MKILSPDCTWTMSITLNRLECFDNILHTHWYWRHLVQEIAKWHLSLVEALPSSNFWKSENSPFSWTEWDILTNSCVNIDINQISPRDSEMTFFIGRGFAEVQILKMWKWPYLLNWEEYCDEILHTHWYWHDVAREIVKWHLGSVEVLPRFKFWKKSET